jgi:hypothetical protein
MTYFWSQYHRWYPPCCLNSAEVQSASKDSTFLAHGGDSLSALRLVSTLKDRLRIILADFTQEATSHTSCDQSDINVPVEAVLSQPVASLPAFITSGQEASVAIPSAQFDPLKVQFTPILSLSCCSSGPASSIVC